MSDLRQDNPVGPTLSWHFLNAAAFVGLWFMSFAFSIGVIVALSPQGLRESKAMGVIPIFLILVLNVGAMLLASLRASKRTKETDRR